MPGKYRKMEDPFIKTVLFERSVAMKLFIIAQSQPCHWRNAKNVAKRSLPEIGGPSTPATSLSENVNLFQSLRVLQEGEADTEFFQNSTTTFRSGNFN